MENKIVIQYLEYDQILAKVIKAKFDYDGGWQTVLTSDVEEAYKTFCDLEPTILLLELLSNDSDATNGFDLLKMIKEGNNKKNTIIIVLSDLSQDSDKELARELGVDYYYVKSETSILQLIGHINEALKAK